MSLLKEYLEDIEKFQRNMCKKYDKHLVFNYEVDNNVLFETLRVTCSEGDEIYFSSDDEPEYYYIPLDEIEKIKVRLYEDYNAVEEYEGYIYKDEQGYFLKEGRYKSKHYETFEKVIDYLKNMESSRRDYFVLVKDTEKVDFNYKILSQEGINDN